MKDTKKRAEHNTAVAERLKDPEKLAMNNNAVSERLKYPSVREKHNKHVLAKYKTDRLALLFKVISPRYLKVQRMFVLVVDVSISGKHLSILREKNLFQRIFPTLISSNR